MFRRRGCVGLYGGGADPDGFSNVVLLVPFDTDPPVDISNSGHSLTAGVGTSTDTSIIKFGSASLKNTDVSTSFTNIPSSSDFHFTGVDAAGQWTVEAWVYLISRPPNPDIIAMWDSTANERSFLLAQTANNDFRFLYSTTGADVITLTSPSFSPALNTWIHIAADRDASNIVRFYIDGVVQGSADLSPATAFHPATAPLRIGRRSDGLFDVELNGNFDDVRITKGVARYGGAFTPPTGPHPTF